jgi:chemotaxis protein MotB
MHVPKAQQPEQAVVKRAARRRNDEGHGGAWKVAFADFCLALLCLFLVMWLLAVRQQETLQEMVKMSGGRVFDEGRGRMTETAGGPRGSLISREPLPSDGDTLSERKISSGPDRQSGATRESQDSQGAQVERTSYDSNADLAALARMIAEITDQAGLSGNLQSVITPFGLRVMLHDTDHQGMFEIGGAEPTPPFQELLRKLGPLFSRIENQMVIVGHTDSRQYADHGPAGMSNWLLSSERAMAARTNMLTGGMPARSVLQVVAQGDAAPLNKTDPSAAENRRIELLILTKTQARNIGTMFGPPGQTVPLIDGVETTVPGSDELTALHGRIGSTNQ